jgi:hypothetical protein
MLVSECIDSNNHVRDVAFLRAKGLQRDIIRQIEEVDIIQAEKREREGVGWKEMENLKWIRNSGEQVDESIKEVVQGNYKRWRQEKVLSKCVSRGEVVRLTAEKKIDEEMSNAIFVDNALKSHRIANWFQKVRQKQLKTRQVCVHMYQRDLKAKGWKQQKWMIMRHCYCDNKCLFCDGEVESWDHVLGPCFIGRDLKRELWSSCFEICKKNMEMYGNGSLSSVDFIPWFFCIGDKTWTEDRCWNGFDKRYAFMACFPSNWTQYWKQRGMTRKKIWEMSLSLQQECGEMWKRIWKLSRKVHARESGLHRQLKDLEAQKKACWIKMKERASVKKLTCWQVRRFRNQVEQIFGPKKRAREGSEEGENGKQLSDGGVKKYRCEFKCPVEGCSWRTNVSKERLMLHRATKHHEKTLPEFRCRYSNCGLTTRNRQYLQAHEKRHTDRYRCEMEGCDFVTNDKGSLRRHGNTHVSPRNGLVWNGNKTHKKGVSGRRLAWSPRRIDRNMGGKYNNRQSAWSVRRKVKQGKDLMDCNADGDIRDKRKRVMEDCREEIISYKDTNEADMVMQKRARTSHTHQMMTPTSEGPGGMGFPPPGHGHTCGQ